MPVWRHFMSSVCYSWQRIICRSKTKLDRLMSQLKCSKGIKLFTYHSAVCLHFATTVPRSGFQKSHAPWAQNVAHRVTLGWINIKRATFCSVPLSNLLVRQFWFFCFCAVPFLVGKREPCPLATTFWASVNIEHI